MLIDVDIIMMMMIICCNNRSRLVSNVFLHISQCSGEVELRKY